MQTIPEGFEPNDRRSPLTDPWAPMFTRISAETIELGFHVREAHCNARGLLHGGAIAALADNTMGRALGLVLLRDAPSAGRPNILTSGLSLDYIASAKPGQWVVITPRVIKAGGSSGVVDALITADGAVIARANASFRVKLGDAEA